VCVGAFSQESHSGVDENHNGELYHNSFPYLRELGLESITQVIDYTNMFDDISKFSIYKLGDQWVEHIGSKYSPHNWFWRDLDSYVVPKSHQDKKIGIIFGCDKPYLSFKNDKRIFEFMDTPVNSYSRFDLNKIHDSHFINFYWDPTYPFILLNLFFSTEAAYATPLILMANINQSSKESIKMARNTSMIKKFEVMLEKLDQDINIDKVSLKDHQELKQEMQEIKKLLIKLTKQKNGKS
jgi:hypothetical protein